MRNGVQIILVHGTHIPLWIRVQDENVEAWTTAMGGTKVRVVSIRKGSAKFAPTDRIVVKLPGSSKYLTAFERQRVLEIRDARGRVLERNYFSCKKCMRMTGEMKTVESNGAGYQNLTIACPPCQRTWTLENV